MSSLSYQFPLLIAEFTAGLMFGPALLGLLADFTSVQAALCANAAVLAAVMGVFALLVSC